MIENIRKYNGLIILGLVVIAVALVVGLQSSSMRGVGSGQAYLKIGGRSYSDQEYKKLGMGALELITTLARSGDFAMYQFIYSLAPEAMYPGADQTASENFFIGRMLIRQAKSKFGVYPSDEEISEYTRQMRTFTNESQEFDPESYRHFIDKGIGRLGMTESDFRELISDVISAEKIRQIIGTGLETNRDVVAQQYALASQQINGSLARLDIAPLKDSIKPNDEELKAYWELIQDAFTTEPQRKFSYILASPDMPAEPQAKEEDSPDNIAQAAMTDDAKAKAANEKAEADAKKDAELAELRRLKQRELDAKFDDFIFALEEQDGQDLEELAAKYEWEVKTTELFTKSNPPADMALKLRSNSRNGNVAQELFLIEPTTTTISKISQPIAVGENQWLVARLDEVIESRAKTFEEAKADVRKQYIAEKSSEALKQAAEDAAEKIKAALAEGKSFEHAAKDAGLSEIKGFTEVTSSYRPAPLTEPKNLFQAASTVDPGTLAEPVIQSDSAFLLHVDSREIVKNEEQEAQIDNQASVSRNQNQMAAFSDWLTDTTEAAKVVRYYSQ